MKKYQSHKVVEAALITAIEQTPAEIVVPPNGSWEIIVEGGEQFRVDHDTFCKRGFQVGGYLVLYKDGYVSYSPAAAFENGNAELLPGAVASEALLARLFGFGESLPQKITAEFLLAQIKSKTFEIRRDARTTVCELTMVNGTTYRGESSCAVASEFVAADGEFYAEKDAINKAWGAYGFLLRELRFRAGLIG